MGSFFGLDYEQSLFCSKICRTNVNECNMRAANPRAGSFVGASYERKEGLQRFHTAFWTPGTLVMWVFDWSVYKAMMRNCYQRWSTTLRGFTQVTAAVWQYKDNNLRLKLKMEQEQAVLALLEKEDVFAVLPTSFGKSPIYQSYFGAKSVIDAVVL